MNEILKGNIEIGDRLYWTQGRWEAIWVVSTFMNSDGEQWYLVENEKGQRYWNDEERMRESCQRPKH